MERILLWMAESLKKINMLEVICNMLDVLCNM